MRFLFSILLPLFIIQGLSAQVVDRYPYLQRPTRTTATIAWRSATAGIGTLYLGTSPGVWTDSMSTLSATQKPYFDLAGLSENTHYFYQVKTISATDTFLSNVEQFYTAEPELEENFSFLAYGDCGYNNTIQHGIKNLMAQESANFAIVTGDIDQGFGDDYDNVFFGVYKDLLKQQCHYTCIGNHDTYADGAATYLEDFYLPHNNPDSTERYYSFHRGEAKFICLDANIPYTIGTDQHNWMLEELKCHDKKWLFVFFHQPPWTNAWSLDYFVPFTPYFNYKGEEDMRTDLMPFFEQYKVDFVVNGHSHCYQRGSYNGVQYLVTGGAGSSTMDANRHSNAPNINLEIYENHFVRFDLRGDTARYIMINDQGVHRDSVQIIKSFSHYNSTASSVDASCFGQSDASINLTITGSKAPYSYSWNTGDSSTTLQNLVAGDYIVSITDQMGCTRTDTISITEPAEVLTQIISTTGLSFCEGDSLLLEATGNHPKYIWSTGDTLAQTQVTQGGSYSVVAFDSSNCASQAANIQVQRIAQPMSVFLLQQNGLDLQVSSSSVGDTYFWDFGDGNTQSGTTANTTHQYSTAGTYQVQLIVSNSCGQDTSVQQVQITPSSTQEAHAEDFLLRVHPNPFSDYTRLTFDNPQNETFVLSLYDTQGRIVSRYTNIRTNYIEIQAQALSPGVYIFQLSNGQQRHTGRLVVRK